MAQEISKQFAAAEDVKKEMRRILFDEWDPLSIKLWTNVPKEALEEYDCLAEPIFSFLQEGCTVYFLAQYLEHVRVNRLICDRQNFLIDGEVAVKLKAVFDSYQLIIDNFTSQLYNDNLDMIFSGSHFKN